MLTLEDQTVERLERLRERPSGPQGLCAALAWSLALYLIERYQPIIELDFVPNGRPLPGEADWYGVRLATGRQPGPNGLIRFWDAAVADERSTGNGWARIGSRFLENQIDAWGTLFVLRDHLGLPDPTLVPIPDSAPRWVFYLTLLRAGVDLLVDGRPVSLSRGLAWQETLPLRAGEEHPLHQAGVLGVADAGATEWIGLNTRAAALFVHRRDARLIDRQESWCVTPANAWLPDASWRIGQYLDERLTARGEGH